MSFAGHYGEGAIYGAHHLIEQGFVDFIGTDIHREAHLASLEKALKSPKLHELVNSQKLLNSGLIA